MDKDLLLKKDSPDRERGRERERSRRGDRPSRFSSNTRERSPARERRDRTKADSRVYVSNVAYESKWQDIKDLFRAEVGEPVYVELFTDENDKPRGCGIVEFETPELAARAVDKMHRFDLKGRKLVVREASAIKDLDLERDKYGRPGAKIGKSESSGTINSRRDDNSRSNTWDGNNQLGAMNSAPSVGPTGGGAASPAKFGNTYGLSTTFLESLWVNGPLVSKVFVANLDYKVDKKKLKEVFRLAGKVLHCEINVDKEGKSRGFGVVEYDHPVEAVQAISLLHNQMLYDRRLTVRMDRVDKADGPPKLPEGLKNIGMGLGTNGTILNDVARNLPSQTNPPVSIPPNLQQLQAVAAAQAAQAQLAQGAQLAAHLAGSNTLAPNLSSVAGLLGQSLNVNDLANLNVNQPFGGPSISAGQAMNSGMGPGLAGLNTGVPSNLGVGNSGGLGPNFNALNSNQTSMMGGNNNSFNNPGSTLRSPGSGFGQRNFDSMSAALSGSNQGAYGGFDRENFRSASGLRENSYNGTSRGNVGNGRGAPSPGVGSGSSRRLNDTIIVKNLPTSVNWQSFMEKLNDIGEVVDFQVEGKETLIVRFGSEWEAERAVEMSSNQSWTAELLNSSHRFQEKQDRISVSGSNTSSYAAESSPFLGDYSFSSASLVKSELVHDFGFGIAYIKKERSDML